MQRQGRNYTAGSLKETPTKQQQQQQRETAVIFIWSSGNGNVITTL